MIRALLNLYILLLLVDAILSYLPQYRRTVWGLKIKKAADFSLNPVRKYLPEDLPFDISPLIVFFIIRIAMEIW